MILIIASALIVNLYRARTRLEKINDLEAQLIIANGLEPETIIINDTTVEIKYKDRVIVREVPREGYIKFDIGKYRRSILAQDSLSTELEDAKNNLDAVSDDNQNSVFLRSKYLSRIADLENKIKEKKKNTILIPSSPGGIKLITIKNKGMCFRPQIGIGYNGDVAPYVGIKLLYWNKYGLSVGTTPNQLGCAISRRIDDLIPWLKNTEIISLVGYPYQRSPRQELTKDGFINTKGKDGFVWIGLTVNL